jgi:hypothetical protein
VPEATYDHGRLKFSHPQSDSICGWASLHRLTGVSREGSRGSVGAIDRVQGAMMIDLSAVDLEELAMALADQDGYEHHWLIDPDSGQILFWTEDGGLDGQHPVDLDEVDLVGIRPLPSYVWYQDMADFADGVSDEHAGRRLARAIRGKGARSGGSRTNCTRNTRSCCRPGTPSATAEPSAALLNGWSTTTSSTRHKPRSSCLSNRTPNCRSLPTLSRRDATAKTVWHGRGMPG